ncbi:MAG: hypothetical protein NUV77_20955 [Thermoguttaceae bacterium]|nr:hypothetical protein [Thermoguttaceae bacterium]
MSLFGRYHGNGIHGRRVIVIEEPARLPQFMKDLEVLCTKHAIPVRMKFIAESTSHAGDPMAVYACEVHGCRWREGWIRERRTGQPYRLWAGVYRKRVQ